MSEAEGNTETSEEGIGGEVETSDMTAGETQARGKGWTDKEAWVEGGKDEDDWIPYGAFNKNGSLFSEIKQLKDQLNANDENMANLNKMHAVSMNQAKAEFEKQKDEAIADGNVAAVRAIDKDIAALATQDGPPQKSDAVLLTDWNTDNDWIYDEATPDQRSKAAYAKNQFESAKAKGWSVSQILQSVNDAMENRYTQNGDVNHRRNDPSTSESGGVNDQDTGKTGKATLANMTAEEKNLRKNSTFMNTMDDKEFLVLLTNSRK